MCCNFNLLLSLNTYLSLSYTSHIDLILSTYSFMTHSKWLKFKANMLTTIHSRKRIQSYSWEKITSRCIKIFNDNLASLTPHRLHRRQSFSRRTSQPSVLGRTPSRTWRRTGPRYPQWCCLPSGTLGACPWVEISPPLLQTNPGVVQKN